MTQAHQHCHQAEPDHPCHSGDKTDWLLWTCALLTALAWFGHLFFASSLGNLGALHEIAHSVFELVNTIWWGVLVGYLMICLLGQVPREFVSSLLGTGRGLAGIVRATLAGVLLDLCSHGILMVGARLYERGASTGQVMAFLIASPWNSLSLTLILIALIGLPWTLGFIVLSAVVAIIAGLIFDQLVRRGVLPENANKIEIDDDFRFWPEAKRRWQQFSMTRGFVVSALKDGLSESRMVIRWILFGVLLASVVRGLVPAEMFQSYFGPTLAGLAVTLGVATILEVCSEGSTPLAADILNRAQAPGNSFAFLMGGVATDYTEIMVLKNTTNSLKTALFLPLITVPQILLLGWIINLLAS
jgi:hypothetical protein